MPSCTMTQKNGYFSTLDEKEKKIIIHTNAGDNSEFLKGCCL